jgi:hypothetical protein
MILKYDPCSNDTELLKTYNAIKQYMDDEKAWIGGIYPRITISVNGKLHGAVVEKEFKSLDSFTEFLEKNAVIKPANRKELR